MNSNFLNTSRSNPQFYTFSQLIESAADIDWQEQIQQAAWLDFWQREGHELLEEKWHKQHPDYKQAIELATVEEHISWQQRWEEHACDLSNYFWHVLTCVFENYERDLKKGLQGITQALEEVDDNLMHLNINRSEENAISTESSGEDDIYLDSESLDDEQQQLRLLGLPTSFGVQPVNDQPRSKLKPLGDTESDNKSKSFEMAKDNDEILHVVQSHAIKKIKKKKNSKIPQFMQDENPLLKYWFKRFSLFSRFDQGIQLDRESWFSVTPEKIAKQTAKRLACDVIVDAFCGCGGNAIQFASTCGRVIAVDIDASKLAMAKHNANIYGVAHKIDFIHADFLQFASSTSLRPDVIFLSPPWGGPDYQKQTTFDIELNLLPLGAKPLMQLARRLTNNIGFFLPRNSNLNQVIALTNPGHQCEMEHNYLDTRLVAITAYYGDSLITKKN